MEFTEEDALSIKNEMKEETSIHWHGLVLPNFYDGVPYLNTPPIKPGQTLKYEFPINQSGTYGIIPYHVTRAKECMDLLLFIPKRNVGV
jgi:FtsP/CotA-like multicopper oxidase with cupredoxin domain